MISVIGLFLHNNLQKILFQFYAEGLQLIFFIKVDKIDYDLNTFYINHKQAL